MIYQKYQMMSDLSAPFYLETIKTVFQQHLLPKGELTYRGRFCLGIKKHTTYKQVLGITGYSMASVGMVLFIQWFATSFSRHRDRARKK